MVGEAGCWAIRECGNRPVVEDIEMVHEPVAGRLRCPISGRLPHFQQILNLGM